MRLRTTEKQVQNAILDWLKLNKIFAYQNNSVGVFDPVRKIYRKNPQQMKGISDITAIYHGLHIAIEVKSAQGKLRPEQTEFARNVSKAEGYYLLARDIETVEAFIKWIDRIILNRKQ